METTVDCSTDNVDDSDNDPAVRRQRYLTGDQSVRKRVLWIERCWSKDDCEIISKEIHRLADAGKFQRRHGSYATNDLPVFYLCWNVYLLVMISVRRKVLTSMAQHFYLKVDDLYCKDLFFVKYETTKQNGLELHRDGALLSFNILLSEPSDFIGGGTFFQHLDAVVSTNKGDALAHDSQAMHAGNPIQHGGRIILVGFIEHLKEHKLSIGTTYDRVAQSLKSVKERQRSRAKNQLNDNIEEHLLEGALSLICDPTKDVESDYDNESSNKLPELSTNESCELDLDLLFAKGSTKLEDIIKIAATNSPNPNLEFDDELHVVNKVEGVEDIIPKSSQLRALIFEETGVDPGEEAVASMKERVEQLCALYDKVRREHVLKHLNARKRVVIAVKPVDASIDLDDLRQRIRESINLNGSIQWGEMRVKPFVFGLKMIVAACDILESVSLQTLQDKIESFDHVSSTQIVSSFTVS